METIEFVIDKKIQLKLFKELKKVSDETMVYMQRVKKINKLVENQPKINSKRGRRLLRIIKKVKKFENKEYTSFSKRGDAQKRKWMNL